VPPISEQMNFIQMNAERFLYNPPIPFPESLEHSTKPDSVAMSNEAL